MTNTVQHYRDGDPGPVSSASVNYAMCFCACTRCLSGDCCQFPQRDWTPPTVRTTATTITTGGTFQCGDLDHDFNVLDPSRLYCRKCGTTRKVE